MPHSLRIYNSGFVIQNLLAPRNPARQVKDRIENLSEGAPKRGKVSGFSRKSARRLKDFCLSHDVPGSVKYAITLTIPRSNVPGSLWRQAVENFRARMLRRRIPLIWRIELQRNRMPHLHLVAYLLDEYRDNYEIWRAWVESAKQFVTTKSAADGFLVYCYATQKVDSVGWFRYVLAHSAKHKQEQIGWQGRQWGVMCKSLFQPVLPLQYQISSDECVFLLRCLRRRLRVRGCSFFDADRMQSLALFGDISRLHRYYEDHLAPF